MKSQSRGDYNCFVTTLLKPCFQKISNGLLNIGKILKSHLRQYKETKPGLLVNCQFVMKKCTTEKRKKSIEILLFRSLF